MALETEKRGECMFEEYVNVIKKYAVFQGRASRKEYWMFTLVNNIIYAILFYGFGWIGIIYGLAVFVPIIAVTYRRIQDTGHSGHWSLLMFTGIGYIVVFVMTVMPGTQGGNQYGPDPYGYGGRSESPAPSGSAAVPYAGGNQPAAAGGRLEIVGVGGSMAGRIYPVEAKEILFGRDGSARVRYSEDAPGISRIHCKVFMKGGALLLMDCGSTYGTYLSSSGRLSPESPVPLKIGDTFYLGSQKNGFTIRFSNR